MRVDELFTDEIIDEDIRKWAAGAMAGAALMAHPGANGVEHTNGRQVVQHMEEEKTKEAILAQTMWGEARDHGVEGMRAIGHVVLNRTAANHPGMFGKNVIDVATKSKQFSCWNPGDPNRKAIADMKQIDAALKMHKSPVAGKSFEEWAKAFKLSDAFPEYQRWNEAKALAKEILQGHSTDPTKGALFYHTTHVHPSWDRKLDRIGKVGGHIFYKIANRN